jgi:hypothetical protein
MSGSLETLSWSRSVNWALPCRVEWISDGAVSAFRLTLGTGRFSFAKGEPDTAARTFLVEVTEKGTLSMVEAGSTVACLAAETTAGYPRATGSLVSQTLRMALEVHFAEELQRRRRLLAESFESIGWRELQLQEPEGPGDTRNDLVYRRQPIQSTVKGGGQISSDLVADMQKESRTLTVVPEAIEAQLQRARLIYVRGWHQWELYTEALEKALMVLEASLRELYVRSLGDAACLVSGTDSTGQARSLNVSPDWDTLYRMNGELKKLSVQGRPFPRSKPDLVAFAVATHMLSAWEGKKANILFVMRDMSVHRTGEPMIAWIGWALSGIALAVELINRMWARQAVGLPVEVTQVGTT